MKRNVVGISLQVLFIACCCLIALSAVSCSEASTNPQEPEGGLTLFVQAVRDGDKAAVWERIDATSKQQFYIAYVSLVRMDRIIETYFERSEHKYMRQKTGTNLLREVPISSPQDLFNYLFEPSKIAINLDNEVGATVKSTETNANEPWLAVLNTRANQQYVMIQEQDGLWRTACLRNVFDTILQPIRQSEAQMKEYAKENFKAEIDRRREVIDYFLKESARREALRIRHS